MHSSGKWISRSLQRCRIRQTGANAKRVLLLPLAETVGATKYFGAMADRLSKQPANAPGPWYVDTSCALCRLCLEEAPNLLKYNADETAAHFFKQPETPEEMDAAVRAMDVCPTLAIGNDG